MRKLVIGVAIAVLACNRPAAQSRDAQTVDDSKCEAKALGLGNAEPLSPWKMPASCKYLGGSAREPLLIETAEHFSALFACDEAAGKTGGIDFGSSSLVFAQTTLSPAGVGTNAVDDGVKVTLIAKQRQSCANDPPPMPVPYTIAFVVPGKAKRAIAQTACTVESRCR